MLMLAAIAHNNADQWNPLLLITASKSATIEPCPFQKYPRIVGLSIRTHHQREEDEDEQLVAILQQDIPTDHRIATPLQSPN